MEKNAMYVDDTDFLEEIRQWLEDNGEVFVVIESDVIKTGYTIVKSYDQFLRITRSLPGRTRVFVFQDRQLPLRGVADESMRQKALQIIDEAEDFLILGVESEDYLQNEWFHGDMHGELEAKFEDFYGKSIAFGKMPPWYDADQRIRSAKMQFAHVPLREIGINLQQLKLASREVSFEHDDPSGYRTKLGGKPDWLQGDETPICPECNEREIFICQIDSIDDVVRDDEEAQTYMFGDAGMIYVFFCFACGETHSVFQCH
jgi:hypothetical protein